MFPAFQRGGLGRDPTTVISTVFAPFFTCFLGAVQTCRSPTDPPHLYLYSSVREDNCMQPIFCVCKYFCLTFAYSEAVCLVAITPKENRINTVSFTDLQRNDHYFYLHKLD